MAVPVLQPCFGSLFLVLFGQFLVTGCQVIKDHPTDVAKFADEDALFFCIASDADSFDWKVNGTDTDMLPSEVKEDIRLTSEILSNGIFGISTLSIIASTAYNGTRVQCVVTGGRGSVNSNTATLTIQGHLSPVGDLRISENATSFNISWTPPFSLDVTDEVFGPNMWYSVLIYNVTDETNTVEIPCSDCDNITQTYYIFTPDYFISCHKYQFFIIPINGAGQGETSSITLINEINLLREAIKAQPDGSCIIDFTISGQLDEVNTITLLCNVGVMKSESIIEDGRIEFVLPADREYSTSFELNTTCGIMSNVSSTTFTTFDVQNPMVESVADNMISISLEFIEESSALGCFVVLEDHFNTNITFVVLKQNAMDSTISQNISVSASTYTVYFYDLEDNALPNTHPAVSTLQVVSVNGSRTKPADDRESGKESGISEELIISESGSNVTIDCFAECSSYLVVYRAYGDPTLNLIHNTTFPVTISLEIGTYTFAVFGITESSAGVNDIDETPLLRRMVRVMPQDNVVSNETMISTVMISVPTPTLREPTIDGGKTNIIQIAISCIGSVVVLLTVVGISVILVLRQCHVRFKRKTDAGVACEAKNVVYDEVILPPTTSSSSKTVISTQPNAAYGPIRLSPIITSKNIAYELCSLNVHQ